MHQDEFDNLLLHMHGQKSVVLVDPQAAETGHASRLRALFTTKGTHDELYGDDAAECDLPRMRCTLEPGDALYIPFGWYHDVESRDATVSAALRFDAEPLAPEAMVASALDL